MLVAFCVPSPHKPVPAFFDALAGCLPSIEQAGWQHALIPEVGNVYISNARDMMTRKALDLGADVIMYLDHDLAWQPKDMVRILSTTPHVVAGTYRFKKDEEEYMCNFTDKVPVTNNEGLIRATSAPAGFLKVTKDAISIFAKRYPHLLFGDLMHPYLDLFNHGAIDGTWYGEDYAFCKRWRETGNELWICPDLDLTHYDAGKAYPGNFHKWLINYKGERAS